MTVTDFKPFDGFVLDDFIRHLATWPRDTSVNKDVDLDVILLMCREWVQRENKIVYLR